jgi:hypothetical protein
MWKTILDTRVLIAEDLGAAPAPWCSRRWSAKPEGAQPADTRRGGEVRQPTCRRWLLCFIPIHSVTSTDSPRSCSVHRPDPPESH